MRATIWRKTKKPTCRQGAAADSAFGFAYELSEKYRRQLQYAAASFYLMGNQKVNIRTKHTRRGLPVGSTGHCQQREPVIKEALIRVCF